MNMKQLLSGNVTVLEQQKPELTEHCIRPPMDCKALALLQFVTLNFKLTVKRFG